MTHTAITGPASYVRPGDWAAEPAACSLTFAVRNFVLGTVTGQIPLASATVRVDAGGHPVSIRAELDADGIDTGHRPVARKRVPRRSRSRRRWPVMRFEAASIQPDETGWTVTGTLTVKDRQCPVRLDVAGFTIPADDPAACVDLHATGRLDRRSAGVTAPGLLIGHLVTLSLAIRLRPPVTTVATAQAGATGS